ncbi:MAG: hypothetical protein EXS03_07235 [Phycisphaerales bacterium]|nr:hypothetical protein [Phycisphaerales bacterium]
MLKRIATALVLLATVVGVSYAVSSYGTSRPDCPGKVVCPLTGELVCKDRCPLSADAMPTDASTTPSCCAKATEPSPDVR